jgi:PilZ domain
MPESRKAVVVRDLHALQERLTSAHLAGRTAEARQLVHDFNTLLVHAREQFPRSDTLRLIEPLATDAGLPVLAVRLVMMRRTIDAELAESPSADRDERRRWQRRPVTWSARVLIDGMAIAARAVDASRHGLRLVLDGATPTTVVHGQKCSVEVHLADSSGRFVRYAEICHADEQGVGLTIPDALPAGLVASRGEPKRPLAKAGVTTAPAPGARRGLPWRLLALFGRRRATAQ